MADSIDRFHHFQGARKKMSVMMSEDEKMPDFSHRKKSKDQEHETTLGQNIVEISKEEYERIQHSVHYMLKRLRTSLSRAICIHFPISFCLGKLV